MFYQAPHFLIFITHLKLKKNKKSNKNVLVTLVLYSNEFKWMLILIRVKS